MPSCPVLFFFPKLYILAKSLEYLIPTKCLQNFFNKTKNLIF